MLVPLPTTVQSQVHVRKIVSLLQSREVESEFSNFWVGLGTTTSEDAVLWV